MLYDAAANLPLMALEDLGFVPRGESGAFVADGHTAIGGSLPVNTNGGGLNYTHSGMYGMYALQESIRQLRGEAAAQVDGVTTSLTHAIGGMFQAAATVDPLDRARLIATAPHAACKAVPRMLAPNERRQRRRHPVFEREPAMSMSAIDELRSKVSGEVIVPGDAGYEEARKVYNGMIDKRPAAVVRATGPGDVAAVIGVARSEGLDLSVRGGAPQRARVRHQRRRVGDRPQRSPGRRRRHRQRRPPAPAAVHVGRLQRRHERVRPGDDGRDHRLDRHRRADPRWRHRLPRAKYGLSCDNLLSAEVVTADGEVITASEKDHERSVLGVARGWRQLRGRHHVRVPAAPGRGDLRRADRVSRRPG